jgi:hypothetical protein
LIEPEQGLAELADEVAGGLLAGGDTRAGRRRRLLPTQAVDMELKFIGEVDEELVLPDELVEGLA